MDKFKGYLICTDCDGTLTNSDKLVSEENAKAIKYFMSEGGLFTLATGRFPSHIQIFENQFKVNAPIVSLNGALLYDTNTDTVINTWPMKKDDCVNVLNYVREKWPHIWGGWITGNFVESTEFKPSLYEGNDDAYEEYIKNIPDLLYKNLFFQPADITKQLQKELKDNFGDKFRFDLSWPEGIEMQSIDSGKGLAIKYMKEHLNMDIHTTIGVGDYENDLSMMEYADISYAVANAVDEVKGAATRVTVSNDEDAIAKIIYELEP